MEQIVKIAEKKSTLVFVDETFIELVPYSNPSLVKTIKSHENLIILRSFTKSFGLAGLRIGYGLGSKKIIGILQRIKIPWNVNYVAQTAASAALCYSDFLEKSRKNIKKENLFLMNSLSKLKWLSCFNSSTNFILIKTKINSKILQKKLDIKNSQLQIGLAESQNEMQSKNAVIQKSVTLRLIESNNEQIEQAQKIYNQSVIQLKEGIANLTELLLADNALREAQNNYLTSIIYYMKSDLELKKIKGNISTKK